MLSALLLLSLQSAPMAMPMPAQTCPAQPVVPPEFSAWSTSGAAGEIGKAFVLTGSDPATAHVAVKPSRPGSVAVVTVNVVKAETYRVVLGAGAWIDIVSNGTSLPSKAHSHGPACSGIGKIVDFALTPGRYTLQVSEMKTPTVRVLIIPGA